jgi:hypothetical protein
MKEMEDIVIGMLVLLILMVIYFFPTAVAYSHNRKNKVAILVLNIFLGWTFFGWVGALVWAYMKD